MASGRSVWGFQKIVPKKTTSFADLASSIYKEIPKPYTLYKHTFTINEDYVTATIRIKSGSSFDVTGYDRIYDLEILYDASAMADLLSLNARYNPPTSATIPSRYQMPFATYANERNKILTRPPRYESQKIYLREEFTPLLHTVYVNDVYTATDNIIYKFFVEKINLLTIAGGANLVIDPDKHLLDKNEIIDDAVYLAIDIVSLIPGADTPCEIVGAVYSFGRRRYAEMALYAGSALVTGASIASLSHLGAILRLEKKTIIYKNRSIVTGTDEFVSAVGDITGISDNSVTSQLASHPQAWELFWYDNRQVVEKISNHPQRGELLSKIKQSDDLIATLNRLILSPEQEQFLSGLKNYYNTTDAERIFDYYEKAFFDLKVVERGTKQLVDGRAELLKMISNYSNRSDLVSEPLLLNCWAFLGNFPNIRTYEDALQNVKTFYNKKLYEKLPDVRTMESVQQSVNSSNNVQELLESLARANTPEEFALALRDIKTIDFPTGALTTFALHAANVHPQYVPRYNTVVSDLNKAIKDRAVSTLTQTEKALLSEQIGALTAEKVMLEQGYIPLEHRVSLTSKQGQFDGIFWNGNENNPQVFLIEAKGGSSPLGSREVKYLDPYIGQRAQQGTPQYRDDIIANMREKVKLLGDGNLKQEVTNTLNIVDNAALTQDVTYILVRQEINQDGTIADLTIAVFPK